jgi:hypothetical protein
MLQHSKLIAFGYFHFKHSYNYTLDLVLQVG